MNNSVAFVEIGCYVEDGEPGYAGTNHLSFVARRPPCVAHVRATPVGAAALDRILRDRRAGRGR
ncbi:hypothetical protein [Trinickia acidisoli]|uniref:hypothetical protein n=1 Tax=Trinickia acidisoli TaxID=2767482 RepID=UPI001A8BF700|nr:hypothetical protein [Trinickia acidisoli]